MTVRTACKYGSHRVLKPKGVLPQPALQIDNDVPDKVVETFKADADLLWAVKVDFSEAAR